MLHKTTGRVGRLKITVADVAGTAGSYADLGVRVVRQSARQAVLELPCGVHLVLLAAARPDRRAVPPA
jgi:hypothetical protein